MAGRDVDDDVSMAIPQLPLEVVSHIISLLTPPFYPPGSSRSSTRPTCSASAPSSSSPPSPSPHVTHIITALDPHPSEPVPPLHTISRVSKASHELLGAARPWLWENVDVKSGRGWLAVVNALTEEVIDPPGEEGVGQDSSLGNAGEVGSSGTALFGDTAGAGQSTAMPVTTTSPAQVSVDLPAADAHVQPNTVPGGMARYTSVPPPTTFPYPIDIRPSTDSVQIQIPPQAYSYSPTQPQHLAMLLTPPGSRNASPHPNLASAKSPTSAFSAACARLRGRSRSPRRSIEFETESLQAVIARSRSTSGRSAPSEGGSWPRPPMERRRSSLSRHRTREEVSDDEEEEVGGAEGTGGGAANVALESPEMRGRTLSPTLHYEEVEEDETWFNVNPELLPPPGPYIRHLSFTNFRTIGSRRTQDEAVRGRFVTAGRFEGVIKNAPNLLSVCMTEYVDSSLSYDVLEELFFRGQKRPRLPRRMSPTARSLSRVRSLSADPTALLSPMSTHTQLDPPRPEYVPYEDETDQDKWRRRAMFTPLEALDLTACVSAAFTQGMREFWDRWYAPDEGVSEEDERERERGRSRARTRGEPPSSTETEEDEDSAWASRRRRSSSRRRTPMFPAMRRMSLRACWSLDTQVIDTFLLSFPNLTHLDLSNSKVSSSFLTTLTERPPRSLRFESLSLARCPRLDPYVIVDFLCRSPAAEGVTELNLFVNPTQGNAIRSDDLMRLITTAPCFKSGKLRYLDLSSARFTPEHLAVGTFNPQPCLVSLGLSHIPALPLPPIANFLLHLAPNVEVLTLTGTAFETSLHPSASPLQITLELHAKLINPLTTVPFSLSSLTLNGSVPPLPAPGPTKLRVIELSSPIRRAIGPEGGSHEWKVIRSKGGRGWYVDVSAGWVQDVEEGGDKREWRFARKLPMSDPWRRWLTGLCEASGRVSSSVGWHARKMDVIRGMGMLGREEGMAGAGAFAFEE